MILTRHQTLHGPRWARDGHYLPAALGLSALLALPKDSLVKLLESLPPGAPAAGEALAPIDPGQEVWACGVTYQRSRDARQAESQSANVYERVYRAERPEVFLKATGWRVVGPAGPVRVRGDSHWTVPEPEMVLVANSQGEIVGYCAGNDMSSRDIEGENPLYVPQAKIYDGACALGPGIVLADPATLADLPVHLVIRRASEVCFEGRTRTSQMARPLDELVAYILRELTCPQGVFIMTGTGIVPPDNFALAPGDRVRVEIGDLVLENEVAS
jgi:2-dehydro-3-deoxy-D-arabinonate dehydratase